MNTSSNLQRRFLPRGKAASSILIGFFLVTLLPGLVFAGSRVEQGNDRLTPIQREIERQRQRLSSAEVEERRDALTRLGNLKRAEASRAAVPGLSDALPVVRVTAAHAIVSLPSTEVGSLLTSLLKDKSEFVRREAAYVLGETRDRAAVTALMGTLRDKQPSVRGAAAVALGQIGDEVAVTPLSQMLIGDPGKKKKSRENDFVMRSAAKSLGQIRSRAAVPALIATLENSSNAPDTRREAATALGMIGDSSAMPALQAAFSSGDDPYLTDAARTAIRLIRSKN